MRSDDDRPPRELVDADQERALGRFALDLLHRSHGLEPSEVFTVVAEEAATVGLHELRCYLVDKAQITLICATDPHDRVPVVGSVYGDCYAHLRPRVLADAPDAPGAFDAPDASDGGSRDGARVVVPLVDGEDRLGIIVARTALDPATATATARVVAPMLAEILVSKGHYTDEYERVRRTQPMDVGAEFRWSLVPPLTFRSPRVSIASMLMPAYSIAGDAFDYAINGDEVHLGIFDAVGHELGAARVANLALAACRSMRRSRAQLWDTCSAIDALLAAQFVEPNFVTAVLGTLNLETGWLRWVNAGHPLPLVLRRGKIVAELQHEPMPPLGLQLLPTEPRVGEYRLEPGDTVLLFSDGVTEARAADGSFFGGRGLQEHLVRAAADALPDAEALRRLVGRLFEFSDGRLRDDATLMLVTWRP